MKGAPALAPAAPAKPYRRSGLDALVDAVEALPGWTPLKYALLALVAVAAVHVAGMTDGSLEPGELSLPLVSFGVWSAYVLAAKAYVRASARRAVEDLRPALSGSEAEVARIRYRLTTQPALPTFLAAVLFVGLSAPSTFLDPHYLETTGLFTSAAATVVHAVMLVLSLWLTGAAGYGILHTLRVIDEVYVRHARIDVLAPQDLFSLSRLASRAALAVLLMQYIFVAANPAALGSRAVLTQLVVWELLAAALFIWPLWNAHRLLERAKSRLRWELGKRLERVTNALTAAVDAERYERVAQLKEALGALQAASQTVDRASTWPWAAETPRLFVSALLLPMLAWLLQQLLSRLVG